MTNLTRRHFSTGLGASLALSPLLPSALSAMEPPMNHPALSGESLMNDISTYVNFGIHRTGLAADIDVSDWQQAHLESLGFAVTRSAVPIRQYIAEKAQLFLGGKAVDIHPQWPLPQASFDHTGPIVDRVSDAHAPITEGAIVMVRVSGNTIDTEQNLAAINPAIKSGAAAIVAVSTHDSGDYQIGNVLETLPPFAVPVFLMGERYLAASQAAGKGILTLKGVFQDAVGHSVTGKLDRGEKWIIVSTPQSGWTECAGERGPGIATFRAFAKIMAERPDGPSLCFTSNSGHEFHNLGARLLHEEGTLPPPAETALWLHLGAGFASRAWTAENFTITHLDSHAESFIMATPDIANSMQIDFAGLNAKLVSTDQFNVGEMLAVTKHGYEPALGVVGYHSHHHIMGDREHTTSPTLLEGMARALLNMTDQALAT